MPMGQSSTKGVCNRGGGGGRAFPAEEESFSSVSVFIKGDEGGVKRQRRGKTQRKKGRRAEGGGKKT